MTTQNTDKIRFRISISFALIFVGIMWIIKIFELTLNVSFADFGVYPLTVSGLKGILFSPFIHGDLKHIFSNTFPTIILLAALIYFYPKKNYEIFVIIYFASGIILWVIGRQSFHIGVSGLIYALAAFHFFSGILSKRKDFIAISLIVVFLYGGIIWGLFPTGDEKISWEGHLSGFAVGAFLSVFYHTKPIKTQDNLIKIDFIYPYNFENSNSTSNNLFLYYYTTSTDDTKKHQYIDFFLY